MQARGLDPARVRDAVEALKLREELRGLYQPRVDEDSWWLRMLKNLFGDDSSSGDLGSSAPAEVGGLMSAMPYVVEGLVLVAVVVMIVVFFMRASGARKQRAGKSEKRRASLVIEQLELARAARAAGDLGAALRAFWAALVTGLGRGDELVYRSAWTCREMLVRSNSDGPDAELLAGLLPRIERLEFGRFEITARDVDELAELCAERLV